MPIGVFALFWMFAVANIASTCRATAWPYLKETLNANEAPFSSRSPPFLSDIFPPMFLSSIGLIATPRSVGPDEVIFATLLCLMP